MGVRRDVAPQLTGRELCSDLEQTKTPLGRVLNAQERKDALTEHSTYLGKVFVGLFKGIPSSQPKSTQMIRSSGADLIASVPNKSPQAADYGWFVEMLVFLLPSQPEARALLGIEDGGDLLERTQRYYFCRCAGGSVAMAVA